MAAPNREQVRSSTEARVNRVIVLATFNTISIDIYLPPID